jgi:muramoyltetrapeptide carboxypeptidase
MKQDLIIPPPLRPGDTIGIAAPASPFDRKAFEQGVAVLESMGYNVRIPDDLFEKEGYLAGRDEDRASQLMRLFQDDSVRAVFCARGGFGSMRVLPLLDFEALCARPKILLGFSDITALLVAVHGRCNLVTFHGPLVTTLRKASENTRSALINAVGADSPLTVKAANPKVLRTGKAFGPVLGGNLTSLCHLMGTPYEPSFEGRLLFLEDRGEAPYRIDRMLTQLKLGHHLQALSGVILGSFEDCGKLDDVHQVVKNAFGNTDIPILAGFDIGHSAENLTVPIGVQAELNAEEGTLRFKGPATREEDT